MSSRYRGITDEVRVAIVDLETVAAKLESLEPFHLGHSRQLIGRVAAMAKRVERQIALAQEAQDLRIDNPRLSWDEALGRVIRKARGHRDTRCSVCGCTFETPEDLDRHIPCPEEES